MNKPKVKSVEVQSIFPDADGNHYWREYDTDDVYRLSLWNGAKYRFRYEDNTISEERHV